MDVSLGSAGGPRPDHPGVLVPPPLFYLAIFGLGVLLDRVVLLPSPPATLARMLALALVAAAGVLFGWSLGRFRNARTTVAPFRPSSALVVEGPYRFTRNPMYLGLLSVYTAAALWFGFTWPLLLIPLVLLVVGRFVIAREERSLERAFGDDYVRYRETVRRWL